MAASGTACGKSGAFGIKYASHSSCASNWCADWEHHYKRCCPRSWSSGQDDSCTSIPNGSGCKFDFQCASRKCHGFKCVPTDAECRAGYTNLTSTVVSRHATCGRKGQHRYVYHQALAGCDTRNWGSTHTAYSDDIPAVVCPANHHCSNHRCIRNPVNCQVSAWVNQTGCDHATCSRNGNIRRKRNILVHPAHGGSGCPHLEDTVQCGKVGFDGKTHRCENHKIIKLKENQEACSGWKQCKSRNCRKKYDGKERICCNNGYEHFDKCKGQVQGQPCHDNANCARGYKCKNYVCTKIEYCTTPNKGNCPENTKYCGENEDCKDGGVCDIKVGQTNVCRKGETVKNRKDGEFSSKWDQCASGLSKNWTCIPKIKNCTTPSKGNCPADTKYCDSNGECADGGVCDIRAGQTNVCRKNDSTKERKNGEFSSKWDQCASGLSKNWTCIPKIKKCKTPSKGNCPADTKHCDSNEECADDGVCDIKAGQTNVCRKKSSEKGRNDSEFCENYDQCNSQTCEQYTCTCNKDSNYINEKGECLETLKDGEECESNKMCNSRYCKNKICSSDYEIVSVSTDPLKAPLSTFEHTDDMFDASRRVYIRDKATQKFLYADSFSEDSRVNWNSEKGTMWWVQNYDGIAYIRLASNPLLYLKAEVNIFSSRNLKLFKKDSGFDVSANWNVNSKKIKLKYSDRYLGIQENNGRTVDNEKESSSIEIYDPLKWDQKACCLNYRLGCDTKFSDPNSSECRNLWETNCKDNLDKEGCEEFTRNEVSNYRTGMDKNLVKYCEKNPTKPECKCILRNQTNEKGKFKDPFIQEYYEDQGTDPVCWYEHCLSAKNPFMTGIMKQKDDNCPSVKNCIIKDITVSGSGPVNFSQDCSDTVNNGDGTSDTEEDKNEYTNEKDENEKDDTKQVTDVGDQIKNSNTKNAYDYYLNLVYKNVYASIFIGLILILVLFLVFQLFNSGRSYSQTPYSQTPYPQTPYPQTPYSQTPYPQTPYSQTPYSQQTYSQQTYSQN